MRKKYKKYDILEILWIDSHGSSGWKAPSEIEETIKDATHKWLVKTVGYYLSEDKDFLRVVMSHDHTNLIENSRGDNIDNYTAVAQKTIKEVSILKYINKKKSQAKINQQHKKKDK